MSRLTPIVIRGHHLSTLLVAALGKAVAAGGPEVAPSQSTDWGTAPKTTDGRLSGNTYFHAGPRPGRRARGGQRGR